jgi:hypothetical protein
MNTLAITFSQVKIDFEVQNVTFESLEAMAFDISRQIGMKALEDALKALDQKLKEERPQGVLKNTGRKQKHLMTRLGDIRYQRTRYIEKQTGKARYLLEEKLGLKPNQRISLSRAKTEMFIASIDTYRGAKKNAELLLGITRSHESIRQSVLSESRQILAHQAHELGKIRRLEGLPKDPLSTITYLEADSVFVRKQRTRKRKTASKLFRRKRRSIEIKLGIGYTGRTNRYQGGARLAQSLDNKFIHSGVGSGSGFMEDLSLIAEKKLAISKAKTVICGGDGASWIQKGIEDNVPNGIYVLCRFHLWRNLKRALPGRIEDQKTIKGLIQANKIADALNLIARRINQSKDLKAKKELRVFYAYVRWNQSGINSLDRIGDKTIKAKVRGTGAIESNADKFIAQRMKKRGMSWSEQGALGLLKIKEKIVNGQWDSWWTKDRNQKIDIKPRVWQKLSSRDFWKKERSVTSILEAEVPALQGPNQNKPWARVLRELQTARFYS